MGPRSLGGRDYHAMRRPRRVPVTLAPRGDLGVQFPVGKIKCRAGFIAGGVSPRTSVPDSIMVSMPRCQYKRRVERRDRTSSRSRKIQPESTPAVTQTDRQLRVDRGSIPRREIFCRRAERVTCRLYVDILHLQRAALAPRSRRRRSRRARRSSRLANRAPRRPCSGAPRGARFRDVDRESIQPRSSGSGASSSERSDE